MTDDGAAEQREIIDVGTFYQLLTAQLESAYGRRHPRWIRGEVAKVYEKTHLYVDLVDAGSSSDTKRPVLNAHCWATQWNVIKRRLSDDGVTLKAGTVVNLFGYVDLYAPSGRIGFTVTEVDVAGLLGDVARRRLELIARLRAEGLLEDRWDDLRSRLRDWRNVLVAAGELVLLYLIVLVLGRLDLGGKK